MVYGITTYRQWENADFFLCRVLQKGYLNGIAGEYSAPDVYYVEEEDVEAFDKIFPPMEKLKLPGQLF